MFNILYYILEQQHPVYLRQLVSCAPDKVKDRLVFLATMGLADLKKSKWDPTEMGFADFEELQFAMRESITKDEDVKDIIECVKTIITLQEERERAEKQNEVPKISKLVVKETLKPRICPNDIIKTLPLLPAKGAGRKKKTT